MKRKLLAVLLACLLVWSCAGMAGAANAAVYFGDAKVENDVITVTLAVRGNTASSGSFTVSYDGKLTLPRRPGLSWRSLTSIRMRGRFPSPGRKRPRRTWCFCA